MKKISDIEFSNLYLGKQNSWYLHLEGGIEKAIPLSGEFDDDAGELSRLCIETENNVGRTDFAVTHNDVRYRVSRMPSISDTYYVLRRFPDHVPSINDLGIHPGFIKKLMQPHMTGLLIFAGATNQGKTWSASSLLVERLKVYGGVATTAEDPPEMPLEGSHGAGMCFQTWAARETGGFAEACRNIVRWNPTIILLGEIRDSDTAVEAIKASINGHLVICTVHADSAITAIERIQALASSASEDLNGSFASGLAAVLHQRLEGESQKRLVIESLFVFGDENEAGIRQTIRIKKTSMLTCEIQLQKNKMLTSRSMSQ